MQKLEYEVDFKARLDELDKSIAKAEQLRAANERIAGSAQQGVNPAKAVAEAHAQQLATDQKIQALTSSLVNGITIAGAAGVVLFGIVTRIVDENARITEETKKENDILDRQREKWEQSAATASNFADVVRLGAQEISALDHAAEKLTETLDQQKRTWDYLRNAGIETLRALGGSGAEHVGSTTDEEKKAEALRKALSLRRQLNEAIAAGDKAEASSKFFQQLELEPASIAVDKITQKLAALGAEEKKLQAQVVDKFDPALNWADPKTELAREKALRDLQTAREEIQSTDAESRKFTTALAQADAQTSKFATDQRQAALDEAKARGEDVTAAQHQLDVERKIAELKKSNAQALRDGQVTQQQINSLAEREVTNAENAKNARSGLRNDQREYNALLHEESDLLRGIRLDQQVIAENPGLTPDEKGRALNAQLELEKQAIDKLIDDYEAYILAHKAAAASDEEDGRKIDDLIAKIDELRAHRQLLTFKQSEHGSFFGDFDTELRQWVDGFGTAGAQAGKLVEGSIGAALQGTNQLLLDSAFRTGDWKQALLGVEEQIGSLFLTYVENMILQNTLGRALHTAAVGERVASGPVIAAAHAPAAAAVSISSYGVAAIIGEVLAVAAIAAIIAALTGGFKKGGHTGFGDDDEVAGVAHRNEWIHPAASTRSLGIENLAALDRGQAYIQHFGHGGRAHRTPNDGWYEGGADGSGEWHHGVPPGYFQIGNTLYPTAFYNPDGSAKSTAQIIAENPDGNQPVSSPDPTTFEAEPDYLTGSDYPGWQRPTGTFSNDPASVDVTTGSDFGGYPNPGPPSTDAPQWRDSDPGYYGSYPNPGPPSFDSPPFREPATGVELVRLSNGNIVALSDIDFFDPGWRDSAVGSFDRGWRDNARGSGGQHGDSDRTARGGYSGSLVGTYHGFTGDYGSIEGAVGSIGYGTSIHFGRTLPGGQFIAAAGGGGLAEPPAVYMAGQQGRFADGIRLPGPPSRIDSIHALLAPGEAVIPAADAFAVDRFLPHGWERRLPDLLESMRIDTGAPLHRMADGGRMNGSSSGASSSASRSHAGVDIGVYAVLDSDRLVEMMRNSRHARNFVVEILNDKR